MRLDIFKASLFLFGPRHDLCLIEDQIFRLRFDLSELYLDLLKSVLYLRLNGLDHELGSDEVKP